MNVRPASVELNPRFFEVDSYQIVNNMFYVSWCEMGRFRVAQLAGIMDSGDMAQAYDGGIHFMVTESRLKYHHPIRFQDTVRVDTLLGIPEASRLKFRHTIRNRKTMRICVEANTSVVAVKDGRLLNTLPQWAMDKIEKYLNEQQGIVVNEKINIS